MSTARRLFYLHLFISTACIGFTIFVLNRQFALGWEFDRKLEVLFNWSAVNCLWLVCMASSVVLPFAVGCMTVGKMSSWHWWPLIVFSFFLGWIQEISLMVMRPVRY